VTYIATAAIFDTTDGIPGTTAAIFDGIVVTGVKSRLVGGRQRESAAFCFLDSSLKKAQRDSKP
jgi:hypothetical protein